jgi:hypothetical protein
MGAKNALGPVHFLKVVRHGSATSLPVKVCWTSCCLFPRQMPDEYTLGRIAGRATVARIGEAGDGLSLTFEFLEIEKCASSLRQ